MKTEIRHNPDFAVVKVTFDYVGEQLTTEAGAMVAKDSAVDMQTTLQGVQCESCHGAARSYTPAYVMRDAELAGLLGLVAKPEASSCNRCHTDSSPSLQGFDFAAKRELIKY